MTSRLVARWPTTTFGRLARIGNGSDYSNVEVEQGGYPVYGSGGEFRRASSYLFDGESVLFGRKGTVDRPLYVTGKFWTVDTMFYSVIDRSRLLPRFAYYWATTLPFGAWATATALPSMTSSAIKAAPMMLPSLGEQRAIADYLDRETAQIDAFIAKNEELITLLNERRAVVIARAVTRGLDENAEMKESGVATLGLIPAHWTVNRIRNVGRAIIGLTYSPEDICDEDDAGTLVLRAGNVQNGELVFEDCVYVGKAIPRALRLRLGDIVICARNGSARLIGKNAVATSEVVGQTWGAFMAVLRTPINEYLRWVLNSAIFTSSIGAFATSTINQLTSSTLHSLQFAMPPKGEQADISAYLTEATATTDSAVYAARRAIALARERRAALISAAVTGKIKIGAAA